MLFWYTARLIWDGFCVSAHCTWNTHQLCSFPSQDRAKPSPTTPCNCCVIIQSSGGAYRVRSHQQALLPEVKAPHLCDTSEHQRLIKRVPPGHSQIQAFYVAVLLNHWDSFTWAVRTAVLLLSVCKKTIFRLSKNNKIIQGERSAKWCFHLTQQTSQTNQA